MDEPDRQPEQRNGRAPSPRWWALPHSITDWIAELGTPAFAVLCILGRHADAKGRCYPSAARIGNLAGLCKRSVYRAIDVLHAAGLVCVECDQWFQRFNRTTTFIDHHFKTANGVLRPALNDVLVVNQSFEEIVPSVAAAEQSELGFVIQR